MVQNEILKFNLTLDVDCQMVTLAKRGDAHAKAQARAFLRVRNIFVTIVYFISDC